MATTSVVGAAVLCLSAVILTACGTPQRTLTITSQPQGALLIEQNTGQRYLAPVTLYYDIDARYMDANGCLRVRPFAAVWASGVALPPPPYPVLLCSSYESLTAVRPAGTSGLADDLAAANARNRQLELEAIDQQIRRLQGEAALADGLQSLTHGTTCAAGGGCYMPPAQPEFTAPAPAMAAPAVPAPSKVPPWAKQRDPFDLGTVCDVDIWGRSHCGLKQP